MTRLSLFTLALVLLGCSCTSLPVADGLDPSSSLQQAVDRAVGSWVQSRVASFDPAGKFWDRGYRTQETVDALAAFFPATFDPDRLWDFRKLIEQLKTSELYSSDPPSASDFRGMLIKALDKVEKN